MKNPKIHILAVVALLGVAALACAQTGNTAEQTPTFVPPTEDIQATVNAGIEATMQTEADMQATIDAAVAATVTASQAQATQLSEEEMASEIDQTMDEVVILADEVIVTTEEISSDGTISYDEYEELEELLVDAAILVDYAEYWIDTYYWLYGDLAEETLLLLEELEDMLLLTEEYMDEILAILEMGTEAANQALSTLEQLSQNVDAATSQFEGKSDEWLSQVQTLLETRAADSLNIQANQIPGDRAAAIAAALEYVQSVRGALADNVISSGELQNIAQLGANAVSGLQANGGPVLINLADSINAMTAQAAKGQFFQVANGLGTLESAIPSR
ncbi:MAG: hypothetical protein PVF83_13205 [Anaerolineales bacterium]|jgi:hypothetical protein